MGASLQHLLAASALISACERIASSGLLPENEEQNLRILICRSLRAFDLPSVAERPASNVIQISDRDLGYSCIIEAVAREFGQ